MLSYRHTGGTRPSRRPRLRLPVMLLGGLLLLASVCAPRAAQAVCWFTQGSATSVTFNAGTITLTPSTQIGSVLWTSNTANPANPPELQCDGNTNGGIVNTIAGQSPVSGDNTLFPTGIPGVSYRILHPGISNPLKIYPNYPTGSGTFSFSVASNLQLVYTGPFLPPNDSTLTGQLSQWKVDVCSWEHVRHRGWRCNGAAPQPVETFNVNAIIHIIVPTCGIAPGSVNQTVTLPDMTTAQFTGQGSAVGKTPFSLQLIDCPTNLKVFISLNTSTPQPGVSGTIAPSGAGHASGVGVQLLKADGTTPVTFGTPIDTGTTTASSYAINLYARYYQTSPSVTAGPVKGIATYTLNYQ